MTEEELGKFDKETLVKFIFANPFFKKFDWKEQLDWIEYRVQTDRLFAKDNLILQQMGEATKNKDWAKFDELQKKSLKVHKQLDKWLGESVEN